MALKIYNRPRGFGKTQECIDRLKDEPRVIVMVRTEQQKSYYPKEFHNRVITGTSPAKAVSSLQETNPLKVGPGSHLVETLLIDEGLLDMSRIDIANFYYELGSMFFNSEMYCTDSQEKHTL